MHRTTWDRIRRWVSGVDDELRGRLDDLREATGQPRTKLRDSTWISSQLRRILEDGDYYPGDVVSLGVLEEALRLAVLHERLEEFWRLADTCLVLPPAAAAKSDERHSPRAASRRARKTSRAMR
jgi:hypothetical protein